MSTVNLAPVYVGNALGLGYLPLTKIRINGQENPGLAFLSGFGLPRKWDEIGGGSFGIDGASLRYGGRKLAKGRFRFELYTQADLDAWAGFSPLLEPPPFGTTGPKIAPLDVQHAQLLELKLTSFVVEDRTQLTLDRETGLWWCESQVTQFRRPRLALASVGGSAAQGSEVPLTADQIANAAAADVGKRGGPILGKLADSFNGIGR